MVEGLLAPGLNSKLPNHSCVFGKETLGDFPLGSRSLPVMVAVAPFCLVYFIQDSNPGLIYWSFMCVIL